MQVHAYVNCFILLFFYLPFSSTSIIADNGSYYNALRDLDKFNDFDNPNHHRRERNIFKKLHESVKDVIDLEKLFGNHLNALDQFLSSRLSSKSRPLIPIPRLSLLPDLGVLRQLFHSGGESVRSTAVCHACRVGFGLFIFKARTSIGVKELQVLTTLACKLFKISSNDVCTGLIEMYVPILEFISVQKENLTPDQFCGVVLQSYGCVAKDWKSLEWKLDNIPEPELDRNYRSIQYSESKYNLIIPEKLPTIKIVHLADIHVDPHYVIGSNAKCENELCCRGPLVFQESDAAAGYFGDYRKCDLPYHSLENALEHIAIEHPDTELVYMTGDLIPHDVWTTDTATNVGIIANISFLLHSYFPNAVVIPVVGNHESHPVNMFAPTNKKLDDKFTPNWLYKAALLAWSDWIPQESHELFLESGYYTIKIRSNFRIIVLNTNLCYGFNFWQLYSHKDPGNQLKWLSQILKESSEAGEFVHLVGHVPPGQEECFSIWSKNFYEIIYTYRDIVRSQFYGHTHYDELQLYYHKEDKSVPINTVFMGPSLSPFVNLNPGYKVYYVDGTRGRDSTWHVVDFETWIYNLTQANQDPYQLPKWYPLYRATEAYQIPNLLPTSLDTLIQRMSANETLFNLYYRYYFKDTKESLNEKCDKICRKRIMCNMVTSYYERQKECVEIESEVDGVVLPKRIFEKFRAIVLSPFQDTIIMPIDQRVFKPIQKFGKKFVNIFRG